MSITKFLQLPEALQGNLRCKNNRNYFSTLKCVKITFYKQFDAPKVLFIFFLSLVDMFKPSELAQAFIYLFFLPKALGLNFLFACKWNLKYYLQR